MPRPAVAVAEVRDAVRDRITTGAVPPGARLIERTLADDLGVSRLPVREALRDLVSEGFVAERPTGGMVSRRYRDAEIDELVEVNAALETILVRSWARTRDPIALEALDAVVGEASDALAAGDVAAAVRANAAFHGALTDHAPAGVTRELLTGIGPRLRWLQRMHADPRLIHQEHRELVDALRTGDAEAAATLIGRHAVTSRTAARELEQP